MRQDKPLLFTSPDLYLAAYVATLGHRLRAVDRSDPQRCLFIFEDRPDSEDLAAYVEGRATVNVLAYAQAVRYLKSRIFRDDWEATA